MTTFKEFPDQKVLTVYLADRISELLAAGITDNGQASLAVSGGSTPVELFKRLSRQDIPWQLIVITLVDERWMEPTATDSNEYLVRTHLLQNRASAATFIGITNSAATAGAGEVECEQQLRQVPRPFDVLILGMGDDGHTASLFPGAENLSEATNIESGRTCMSIAPINAPYERMTLTLPVILDSRQIFLHITGLNKYNVLQKASKKGPIEEMPIRFILQQTATPVEVYWAP